MKANVSKGAISTFTKRIKSILICLSVLVVLILGYFIGVNIELFPVKGDEDTKVYEFNEDMDGDGKTENVKFINHYISHYRHNVSDGEYTSNNIEIYLDDKRIYNDTIDDALYPLENPQIIYQDENSPKMKQIFVHVQGGGPAPSKDFYFIFKDGNVILSDKVSSYY